MPSGGSLPQRTSLNAESAQKATPNGQSIQKYSSGVANTFAAAQNAQLTDAALDSYIDATVQGADRALAHKLMKYMPAGQRGDFVYLGADGRLVSNNPSILQHVKLTDKRVSMTTDRAEKPASATRSTMSGYSSSCSPPDPPYPAGGPYVRLVSKCGFAAGWGFVEVPPGDNYFVPGDAGHLYFEVRGTSGSLTEGGFEVYSDASIAPYLRSTAHSGNNGYVDLTNGTARFIAGEQLAIFHGVTMDGAYIYTNSGSVPNNIDPRTAWITSQHIQLANSGWLFMPAPGDVHGAGVDPAGANGPCMGCSVSKVTSIAQNNVSTYSFDGSYFGVDNYGNNTIMWNQVAFGNWGTNCEPGTSLCTFYSASNPYVYYGGPQYYPDSNTSQASLAPSGYGPYETYDGVDVNSADYYSSVTRTPLGTFSEPLPPDATPTPAPTPTPHCGVACRCGNSMSRKPTTLTPIRGPVQPQYTCPL
jgi:hypothetical protein